MKLSDLSFAELRRVLLGLDFSEGTLPTSHHIFEHAPSDTVFIFRPYQANEKIHLPDLRSVRKQLDERGLLSGDSFDHLLRKHSA